MIPLTPSEVRNGCILKGTFSKPAPARALKAYRPINEGEVDTHWRKLNDFALRSFRDTADLDYICARIACRYEIVPQFLWSALQAIEKYLKCMLILNRVPAKRLGHDLVAALRKIETELPFKIDLQDEIVQFIEMVSEQGALRYFEAPYTVRRNEIKTLDWTVWRLRQYAKPLNYSVSVAETSIDMLPIELDKIRRAQTRPPQHDAIDGVLGEILHKKGHPARQPLLWQNSVFGLRARKPIRIKGYMRSANAPLFMHPEILDDVIRLCMFPDPLVAAYRTNKGPGAS